MNVDQSNFQSSSVDQSSFQSSSVDQSNFQSSSVSSEDDRMPIRASFNVPRLNVELRGVLKDGEQGIVNTVFQDFALFYKSTVKSATFFDVSLGGLVVEDLLQMEHSLFRNMMVSSNSITKSKRSNLMRIEHISKSCPDISAAFNESTLSTSLPMEFSTSPQRYGIQPSSPLRPMFQHRHIIGSHVKELFRNREEENEFLNDSVEEFLGSKSISVENESETLVRIKVTMVDKNSDEYITKYNKVSRIEHVSKKMHFQISFLIVCFTGLLYTETIDTMQQTVIYIIA